MARAPRDVAPGIFHITSHAVRSTTLFVDDIDRLFFLTQLAAVVAKFDWTCIQVCLLDTHYHLLLETRDESLPLGMHRLNFRHACRFNSRHGLRGHVLEARYFSDRITSESHLLAVGRYIARNPLEAGVCATLGDWPWSSYGAILAPVTWFTFVDPARVLDCFGGERERAVAQLREFAEAASVL